MKAMVRRPSPWRAAPDQGRAAGSCPEGRSPSQTTPPTPPRSPSSSTRAPPWRRSDSGRMPFADGAGAARRSGRPPCDDESTARAVRSPAARRRRRAAPGRADGQLLLRFRAPGGGRARPRRSEHAGPIPASLHGGRHVQRSGVRVSDGARGGRMARHRHLFEIVLGERHFALRRRRHRGHSRKWWRRTKPL